MPAGCRQTLGQREAAGRLEAGSPEPRPEYRRGCSFPFSAISLIPGMKGLLWRVRRFAVSAPGVETVVNDPPWQMRQRSIGGGDGAAINRWPRQQFAGRLHLDSLRKWGLVVLDE